MTNTSETYAVHIDIPGVTFKVKNERCLIWLCVTTLSVSSILLVVALVLKTPGRA